MNANRTLPQIFILGAALIASALVCSVAHAADATVSFTGVIIPATNNAKPSTGNKESAPAAHQEKTTDTRSPGGESHGAH